MLASCATNDSEEACPCHFGPTALWENPTRTNVTFLPDIGYDSIFVVTPVHNTTPLMPSNFVFNAFSATVWVCIAVLVVMFTVMKMLDPRFSPKDAYTWNDTMQHQQHQLRRRYTMNGFRHGNGDGGSVVDQRERQSNGNKVSDMTERSTGQLKKAASKSKRVAARSKYFALKSRHVYRLRKAFQSTGTLVCLFLQGGDYNDVWQ